MNDHAKTKKQLIAELQQLRDKIAEREWHGAEEPRSLLLPKDTQQVSNHFLNTLEEKVRRVIDRLSETKAAHEPYLRKDIDAVLDPLQEILSTLHHTLNMPAEDVPNLRQAEEECRQLSDIIERSLNEIYVFDPETLRFKHANRGALRNLGCTLEELQKLTPLDLKPEFTETSFRAMIQPLLTNEQEKLIFQTAHRRANGGLYPVEVHLQLIDAGAKPLFLAVIFDITERKQSEEALRQSEERAYQRLAELETIYDSAPVGLCVFDRGLWYVRINDLLAKMAGIPAAEHIGRTAREIIPALADQIDSTLIQVFKTGMPVLNVELTGTTLSQPGVIRDWIAHWLPLRDAGGDITGVNVVVEEITERKQAEEALRQSSERLRLALDAAHLGTWDWNIVSNDIVWNEELYRIMGYEPESVQPGYHAWSGRVHPEDLAAVEAKMHQGMKSCSELTAEYRVLWPEGTVHWAEVRGRFEADSLGRAVRSYGVLTDITERKRLEEERYLLTQQRQLALNAARMGWWHYDVLTKSTRYDKRCREIFGFSSRQRPNEELLKRLHPDDVPHVWTTAKAALNPTDPKPCSLQYRIICDDGSIRWIETHAIATFAGEGDAFRAVSLVGTVVDITERRQMEDELLQSRTELEIMVAERTADLTRALKQVSAQEKALRESEQRLRQLFSQLLQVQEDERKRIANEIHDNAGQVLSAVKFRVEGALQKLRNETPDLNLDPLDQLIPLIQHCIEDMRRLQMELRPTMLDEMGLLTTIRWFCRQFKLTHPAVRLKQDITVEEADVPEELKIIIFRVLQEAMNNAGKHSDATEVSLSLHMNNGALTLCIEDNGQGFDLKKAQKVQAFNKGLGLSSMRERVQYSGGKISIKSAPGRDTRIEAMWSKQALLCV
nr:PAS domain S-box protein [Deltaproteobacteria bacterium]